ncbi:MAG: hypothetical protein ACRC33_20950, partial [Gemmataceae bacterium]
HDRQPVKLPLPGTAEGKRFLLHLHPLADAGEGAAGFGGLVFELVDWTAQARLDEVRENLVGQLGVAVRNDLAALDLASGLLAAGECDESERVELGQLVANKVRHIATVVAQAQGSFDGPLEDGARMPVDPAAALREAIALASGPGRTPFAVRLRQPLVLPFVLAAPDPLRQTFAAVLDFLARDARPNTPIRVDVDQTDQFVRYSFATTGFGLPKESLVQLLSPAERARTEEFRPLTDGLRRLRGWGGVVEADSVVGQGMTVTLSFPSFT